MPKVYLSRLESFSASHRLNSAHLSSEENQKLFGKCNSINGHGHNYKIEVVVCSEVNVHGLTMNLNDLKRVIEEEVISRLDHKHLNLDVAEFRKLNPTAENIALVCWGWLKARISGAQLFEVRIHETEKNTAIYRGE